MKRSVTVALALLVLIFAAAAAQAWTLDQVTFSGAAGSGSNVSYCLVDFGSASYAYKYFWDEPKTGFDMLQALKTEVSGFDFRYRSTSYGPFVIGFTYDGNSLTGDGSKTSNYNYWGYMNGETGQQFSEAQFSLDTRTLANNTWDAWVWGPWPPAQPKVPGAAGVPEPSALLALSSLIGLAGTVKLLRRK